jgi:hypothetical protein
LVEARRIDPCLNKIPALPWKNRLASFFKALCITCE